MTIEQAKSELMQMYGALAPNKQIAIDMLIKASVKSQESQIRPKGHWIMTSDYLTTAYGSVDYVKCSCCGEDSLEEGNYCPNCGAEMESEDKK